MPPLSQILTMISPRSALQPDFAEARSQWQNPTDILSILMIIGGDIVQCALAQSAGGHGFFSSAPVAFSFGWVAYSFSMIRSAVGDHRLLPDPDCNCILINAKSGQHRSNRSWVLGRVVRDFERQVEHNDGLTIAFFRTDSDKTIGVREVDWVHVMSAGVIALQILVSSIPAILRQNYMIFIVTIGGTVLAFLGSILPQWSKEKWRARPIKGREVVSLTPGNGARAVLVIISEGKGLRLEDLATGRVNPSAFTTAATFILAILWLVHLITVESLSSDAWYSLAVGALGMMQNAISAGARRSPDALGLHIAEFERVKGTSVFDALRRADEVECGVGLSLASVFFPGKLRPDEIKWREEREAELARRQKEAVSKKGEMSSVANIVHSQPLAFKTLCLDAKDAATPMSSRDS